MPQPLSPSLRPVSRAMLAAGTAAGVLVLGTAALWVYYGTAVFYEMILAGISACL